MFINNQIEISIIIPTWNRSVHLDKMLSILLKQNYCYKFEIIVVDSKSFDDTTLVINKYINDFNNLRHIHVENSLTSKRNAGFKVAKYDWLLFLDDDVEVEDYNFLSKVAEIDGADKIIYSGLVKYPFEWIDSSNYYKYKNSRHFSIQNNGNIHVPEWSFVAMFFLIRKVDFEKIGRFNEEYKTYGGEDHDFEFRSRDLGYQHRFMSKALAIHREGKTGVRNYSKKLTKSSVMFFTLIQSYPKNIKRSICIIFFVSQKFKGNFLLILLITFFENLLINFLEKVDNVKILNLNLFFRILVLLSITKGFIEIKNRNTTFYN